MTYKEALEHLKLYEYWADFSWMDEVAELAIEAIEKQIPKKPLNHKHIYYICGICGAIVKLDMNYCNKCGQAIDWSKYND